MLSREETVRLALSECQGNLQRGLVEGTIGWGHQVNGTWELNKASLVRRLRLRGIEVELLSKRVAGRPRKVLVLNGFVIDPWRGALKEALSSDLSSRSGWFRSNERTSAERILAMDSWNLQRLVLAEEWLLREKPAWLQSLVYKRLKRLHAAAVELILLRDAGVRVNMSVVEWPALQSLLLNKAMSPGLLKAVVEIFPELDEEILEKAWRRM